MLLKVFYISWMVHAVGALLRPGSNSSTLFQLDIICGTDQTTMFSPVVKLSELVLHEHGNKISLIKLKVSVKLVNIC